MSLSVSIVIPVRNEAGALPRCLEAIARQNYPAHLVELIVVDGHSTDGTDAIARDYGARVLKDGGVSVGEARNRGIREATGDVVAFTDGDCVPDPDWLARLVAPFGEDARLGGVGGGLRVGGDDHFIVRFEDWQALAMYRGFITSNVAYRREVLLEVGGFDPALKCAEDWDLWWRVRDEGYPVAFVPEAVVVHCPVENFGFRAYAEKQFWYAKSDARAFLRRVARVRVRRREGRGVAVRESTRIMGPAATHAVGTALLAAGVVWSAALTGGVVLLGSWAGAKVLEMRDQGAPVALSPVLLGFQTVRTVVRGAGTLVGVAAAAGERVRDALRRTPGGADRRAPSPRRTTNVPPRAGRGRARTP